MQHQTALTKTNATGNMQNVRGRTNNMYDMYLVDEGKRKGVVWGFFECGQNWPKIQRQNSKGAN